MMPLNKVRISWSAPFAYAIGLLTTDGNLSKDGRHINFTSKDRVLVELLKECLEIKNVIGRKTRARSQNKKYFQVQFGDINFYKFLLRIGLTPAKSKTISSLSIPDEYFFDFLRGHFDGDGTFYSYWDPRWRSSFMFYTVFISASKNHIKWLRGKIHNKLKIKGHITKDGRKVAYQLKYAKNESKILLHAIYRRKDTCLKRKLLKIERTLDIVGARL